ncbi:MAG: 23S rRNA (guanosine(2251)-2'-O)-methyltransferase RlmB [Chloroflexota bacterium]|nr:23S rRNA (guanosine(2251)-2'-O)-methyltransferase RlmB [Chloroflexota bacterium]
MAPGSELLYGRNAVAEALFGRRHPRRLFVAEGVKEDERIRAILQRAEERKVPIDRPPRLLLDDLFSGSNHQGVALETTSYPYVEFDDLVTATGTILMLDHLQDPQNFGTLLRAAEAAGVGGVVMPHDRSAEVTPAVVNASAGAVEHLRIAQVPNLARSIEALKSRGRWVVGLADGPAATDLFTTDLPQPAVLVVGAEGSGIGHNVRHHCDLLVSLPMHGRVASLNAATAGAIALYELLRTDGKDRSSAAANEPESEGGDRGESFSEDVASG